MARKKEGRSLNVGTSSILFIFVILCLVSFAILSLSSAMSDYKLSMRIASNTTDYYTACNQAQEQISALEDYLAELYDSGVTKSEYFSQAGESEHISLPVTDIQRLEIDVRITYPEYHGEGFYEIDAWKLVTDTDIEYDDTLF